MHAESWEMNQLEPNILLHHAAYYTPFIEEHNIIASSHRQPTDVTPTPLFFQTHMCSLSAGSVFGLAGMADPQSSDPVVTPPSRGWRLGSSLCSEWGCGLTSGVDKVLNCIGSHWLILSLDCVRLLTIRSFLKAIIRHSIPQKEQADSVYRNFARNWLSTSLL